MLLVIKGRLPTFREAFHGVSSHFFWRASSLLGRFTRRVLHFRPSGACMSRSATPWASTGVGDDPVGSDSEGPTPPTVKRPRRALATVTPFPSPAGPATRSGRGLSGTTPHPVAAPPPPPFHDPASSPGLDALRRELVDELKRGFPRGRELTTADTSAFGVVLVCGDMLVETEDWLALVLAIDKLETDGVLFVKPLETEEGGVDDLEGGREEGVSKNQTPTRLRIATQAPIELLDAAAVMDCLQFETPTDGSGEGMTGTVRDRGVTQNPLPSLLQKQYVLVTTAETECETGLDTTDGQTGLLTTKANRDTPPRDYIATHDSNDNSGFMNPCFENSPSTDADDHNRHVLTEVSEKLTLHVSETHTRDTSENEVSEDAVTVTFVGTSRHTRATQKGTANPRRQSSFSVAPTPVAIDMCNCVGSAALRDALSDASNSKALTLNVLTSDVFLTLQELDALRLFLDEKENEKSHTGKGKKRAEND